MKENGRVATGFLEDFGGLLCINDGGASQTVLICCFAVLVFVIRRFFLGGWFVAAALPPLAADCPSAEGVF